MFSSKIRPHEAKVVLIGDTTVGKTTIITNYLKGRINGRTTPTIGASFQTKTVETKGGQVLLRIWDTAGEERYRSLIPMYSRGANAALIVLDSTKEDFSSIEIWENVVKSNCESNCKIYVIANKIDLEMHIPIEKVREWVEERNYQLFLTSAFDLETTIPMFQKISEDMNFIVPQPINDFNWTNEDDLSSKQTCNCSFSSL